MTGTERITEKIREQAQAAAQALQDAAAREVEGIRAETASRRESARTETERRIGVMLREVEQRHEAMLALELRKRDLGIRQQLVEEAFRNAETALVNLPEEAYRTLMTGMILSSEWTGDAELVVSDKDRARLGESFPAEIDRIRSAKGQTGKTSFSADPLVQPGGFVIRSGEMEINGTLSVVLAGMRSSLEGSVVKSLFDGLR